MTQHERLLRDFETKRVILGVTGSIAAYKAVLVLRLLQKAKAQVQVVLTRSAHHFVGPLTFSGLTGAPVMADMWDERYPGEAHIALGEADAILVAPTTADFLARLSQGRADDLLSATCLSAKGPVLLAPAMHPRMWAHPATRRNVQLLRDDGHHFVGPVDGEVASGEVGVGRLAEPEAIVDSLWNLLSPKRDLLGKHVVVTAGPTLEDIDDVRFLGNRSTGKMGFAVAVAAASRGARVTLISGPTTLTEGHGIRRIHVRSALEMMAAVLEAMQSEADALVMAAAVSDYRPASRHEGKRKKEGDTLNLELVKNPDILATIGLARLGKYPVLVGFAVESENLVAYARQKLVQKSVDLVVANLAKHGFGGDDDDVIFVTAEGETRLKASKREVGEAICDVLAQAFDARSAQPT